MNLPNSISLVRILLIPIILVLMLVNWDQSIISGSYELPVAWLLAGIFFVIAAVSDYIDGYLARKLNQVTTFGKFFDSIADKLLTNSVLIVMSYLEIVPIWLTLILVMRDFLIDALRQILASKQVIMEANWYGKWKAAFQMFGLTLLFFVSYQHFNGSATGNALYDQYGVVNQVVLIPMYLTLALSLYSAGVYFYLNYHYLLSGEAKKSTKVKKTKKSKK
ncbi:CDP-diacylglycerol--glycerol-3-phosphate 3-phosphatidyltransferase [Spiroplasma platyhelix]|uniref:CDP-diacylglycerol--glycerol-3-phosphate 3-phosphatidyltransferase n=1 Tax=Spiroplasma platyhelix PALS-1 TaxID=1276218 RepID=A0A846U8U6_9MOLU|nr:CDP-diacylglycerol--glycerol-3-phosphate 3-phosphatidyltransferase [Spiroplasma platyhelix]MBE4703930.1 CDP-diacylglycerol--glycerol-3-phosphate 3-phosphatidyltransferase [Spiroplasma platyhelix PALS-1]NKE38303.1 CDP-diacylglycerol--glycerol-3-phosphate 3-phosphatidyltransferase [Spiroplasma platyhelix PALS-1]UJB29188.1 CDP-diacylglycerol-glycerol-3-phosphate 3-phosphatidyltransferase [Spiroplasma platyhelix PALS-1]